MTAIVSRRQVGIVATFGVAYMLCSLSVLAADDADCPANPDCGTHNMMLVGKDAAYLSHLPMFNSEHRFQLIVEATFGKSGNSLDRLYTDDRKDHAKVGMYTVAPSDIFALSSLFTPEGQPARTAFVGSVIRGHLERAGHRPIEGLQHIDVRVTRVVYSHEINPGDERSDQLRYILFGDGKELFLAHQITQSPDFDQIIAVKVDGHRFTAADLRGGVLVTIPGRDNLPAKRLRTKERVAISAAAASTPEPLALQLEVLAEPYFEEGELREDMTMDPTPLEKEAGF